MFSGYGGDDSLDPSSGDERSSYFHEPDEVRRFNEQMSQVNTVSASRGAAAQSSGAKWKGGGRGAYRGRGNGTRKWSGGYRKKSGASASASSRSGGSVWGGGGGGAFGMGVMPT